MSPLISDKQERLCLSEISLVKTNNNRHTNEELSGHHSQWLFHKQSYKVNLLDVILHHVWQIARGKTKAHCIVDSVFKCTITCGQDWKKIWRIHNFTSFLSIIVISQTLLFLFFWVFLPPPPYLHTRVTLLLAYNWQDDTWKCWMHFWKYYGCIPTDLAKKLSDNQVQIKNILAVCLRWFLVLNYRIDIMNPLDLKKFSFI